MKKKSKRVSTRVHTRELDRLVARRAMKKAGVGFFRKPPKGDLFAANWREYAGRDR